MTTSNDTSNDTSAISAFDPAALPLSFYENPYATYRDLRQHAPLHRCPDGALFLTRHADNLQVYRDQNAFSSDKKVEFRPKYGDSPLFEHHTTSLVFNDPPLHTRVRRLIAAAFKPGTVRDLAVSVEELVDRLLDRAADKGEFDGVNDFAALIPVEVIGNLLRVPHEDREPLRQWSLNILGALEAATSEQVLLNGNESVVEFSSYLDHLIDDRRHNLIDDKSDILSALIKGEKNGERLTHQELIHNCIFILNAGHETTTNLIGNGINALLEHPDQLERLRNDPQIITSAVEELLRFESPNQLGNRMTVAPVDIGGETIEPGTRIWICIGGANRDPEVFTDPDRLDIGRDPNPHLAFAAGMHTCVGLNVARMEGQIAISRLLSRFPKLAKTNTVTRAERARFRGLVTLPLTVE